MTMHQCAEDVMDLSHNDRPVSILIETWLHHHSRSIRRDMSRLSKQHYLHPRTT